MWHARLGVSLLVLSLTTIHALQFTPDSECAALCSDGSNSTFSDSNASSTNSSDITCEDDEFSSSGKGIRFKNCINCLQKSKDTWEKESDVYWFLYNVRYAFDVCLFSYPDAVDSGTINSPCNIDGGCAPLEDALKKSLLNVNNDNQFDYCEAKSSVLESSSYKDCIECLESTSSQTYLANFLIALKAGCKQRPEQGDIIGLSGSIFTSSVVNITDPNTNETLPGDGGAPVGSMTTGTIVGIAVGCGLAVVGFVCILFIYCCRNRRRGAAIKIASPAPDAPMNDRHLHGIQKSSYFVQGERRPTPTFNDPEHSGSHSRAMSNAQYYNMIEQDIRGANTGVNYHYAPHSKSNGPNGALPAHPAYIPRVVSKLPEPHFPPQTRKPNAPDSYALQTYLRAAEDYGMEPGRITDAAARANSAQSTSRNPSPARQEKTPEPLIVPAPVPAPALEAAKPRLPSFSFPSLHKLVIPKKQAPPDVHLQSPTPISAMDDPKREMRISKPLAVLDPRFQDRPLGGGPVLATEAPSGFSDEYLRRREANKSPLLSGNSRVYG
ncbi:exo-alpha-sialidase neuraminidase [Fusarium albosuccineum]|uniref:Exo-alpha-sialidase neuraminidase n=1 Tax=Fusarium albosuccineum TaxID=1237068 RepID=A0A8H4LLL4_9HYPO|nr:exo-alpha-sialidase neuraminidase [Fusarium albosuccineum]